jgi:hypothetical protein
VSILAIIGFILTAIKYIPEIIQIVMSIIQFLHALHRKNPVLADRYMRQLKEAVVAARAGNMRPLQDLAKELGVA